MDEGLKHILIFIAGLLAGGVLGFLVAAFCASCKRGSEDEAEYARYLRGVSDPRV